LNFRYKIIALAIVPLVIAVCAITTFLTWQSAHLTQSNIDTFHRDMLKAKETEILNLTNVARSAIQSIYADAGPDDQNAKDRVAAILSSLDYGEDGYFFVYDYNGNNVVHPRQTFRPGHNWMTLVDPDGDKVISALIATARAGGGLHQYKWQRPSTGKMADKMSYVISLDKWNWVLGTGVYLDDVFAQTAAARADVRENVRDTFLVVALIAVPSVLVVFSTCMLLTFNERRMADERLKKLTQRVFDAQEEERARLARELHDGISQDLLGIRYSLDLASRKAQGDQSGEGTAIQGSVAALNDAIKEIRRMSQDLRPRVLDDLGLIAAMTSLCDSFASRTGIVLTIEHSDFLDNLRPEARTALFRVAQEALTNVERHSHATSLHIKLWSEKGRARLTIADNGVGLDGQQHDRTSPAGLGLRNMQERMAHFGGLLLIKSSHDGTMLTAMLPRSAALKAHTKAIAA
jgi:two-component system NarL family sensor kinase